MILRKLRFGEADSILHIYSRNYGRISAIAKGVRRSKSRFGGRLEPFFRLDLVLHEGRGDLATVTSADTLDGYSELRARAESLAAAANCADFVLRLLDDRERNEPAYNLIVKMLSNLDSDAHAARDGVAISFRAKMLLAAGFSPELGACVHCGRADDLVAFSPAAGGIVCRDCREGGDFDFAQESYEFLTGAIAAPLADAPQATIEALRQSERAISETLEHHAHVKVRRVVR